ncbi:sulfite exporter TauE/SafE family protein [candidate division KSB1 bacterium]
MLPFSDSLLLVLAGFSGGVIAGLLGVGGGIIMIPICNFIYPKIGVHPSILSHVIFGTNFFVICFSATVSALRYHLKKLVLWKGVFPIAFFSILGALSGATFAARISSPDLLRLFGIVMLFSSVRMFIEFKKDDIAKPRFNYLYLGLTGYFTAILSSMVGVGGGILTIPIMIYLLHFPVRKVTGTSSGIIIFTAIASVSGYIINGWNNPYLPEGSFGFVYLPAGIPLLIGALIGVPLGTRINLSISTKYIKRIFGVVLFLLFIKMTFLQ